MHKTDILPLINIHSHDQKKNSAITSILEIEDQWQTHGQKIRNVIFDIVVYSTASSTEFKIVFRLTIFYSMSC